MNQYLTNAKCINCGFGGLLGDRVMVAYGKTLREIDCPTCGTPNLQIHNGYLADVVAVRDGVVGKMELILRDSRGKFISEAEAQLTPDNKEGGKDGADS